MESDNTAKLRKLLAFVGFDDEAFTARPMGMLNLGSVSSMFRVNAAAGLFCLSTLIGSPGKEAIPGVLDCLESNGVLYQMYRFWLGGEDDALMLHGAAYFGEMGEEEFREWIHAFGAVALAILDGGAKAEPMSLSGEMQGFGIKA